MVRLLSHSYPSGRGEVPPDLVDVVPAALEDDVLMSILIGDVAHQAGEIGRGRRSGGSGEVCVVPTRVG